MNVIKTYPIIIEDKEVTTITDKIIWDLVPYAILPNFNDYGYAKFGFDDNTL
jgi:hypothetical protein